MGLLKNGYEMLGIKCTKSLSLRLMKTLHTKEVQKEVRMLMSLEGNHADTV